MDHYKANQLATQLEGQKFRDYKIIMLLDNGKSAAVFLAEQQNGRRAALKIFDNELIERYGQKIQVQRIQQEISLKGHKIPHLVNILDGGQELIGNVSFFFIIMEFISGQNLKKLYSNNCLYSVFCQKGSIFSF